MPEHELAIVGGGIAGLSAAIIARQIGLDTLLVDPLVGGGQLVNIDRIENYPGLGEVSGFSLGPELAASAMESGAMCEMSTVSALESTTDGVRLSLDDGRIVTASTVILAMGSTVRSAGVDGEVEYHGRGLSYCAVCDGPFFSGKTVAVVGGGDSAVDEAAYLSPSVARVYLIFPDPELHAMASGRNRLATCPNVDLVPETRLVGVVGDESGVTAVRLRSEDTGEERELPVGGVFIYAGLEPNTAFLKDVVDLDNAGHVQVDGRLDTSLSRVMAAGDIRVGSARLLIAAAGDGASAAVRASEWLHR